MTAEQRERENVLARVRYAANVEVEREKVRLKCRRYRRPSSETVFKRRLLRRGLKTCSRCRVVKRLDAFHKNAGGFGGRAHYCAPCQNRAIAAAPSAAPERKRERHVERYQNDIAAARMRAREAAARRRARLRGARVEHVDPQVVWERDEGVCGICGTAADRDDWHLDHVVPLARGGEHSYANTQVSHPLCNRRKGYSLPGERKVLVS